MPARKHVQIGICGFVAKLLVQEPVHSHAQGRFDQIRMLALIEEQTSATNKERETVRSRVEGMLRQMDDLI